MNGNLLPFDSRLRDFTVAALEQRLTAPFAFGPKGKHAVTLPAGLPTVWTGIAGGRIRIVDYKTGAPHTDFAGVAGVREASPARGNPAVLQTLLLLHDGHPYAGSR